MRRPVGSRVVALAVVAAGLAGATLFGLWHVVVGGLIHRNPAAGWFGVALSLVAGGLLAVSVLRLRRLRG
jgi:hypothetical protein